MKLSPLVTVPHRYLSRTSQHYPAMSFIPRLTFGSKFLIPAVAAASIGSAYYFSTSSAIKNDSPVVFKGGDEWIDLKLKTITDASSDTKIFTFEFPNSNDISGLITASCVLAKFVTPKGSNVVRPYTPVSDAQKAGEIDFLIKTYPQGKMSNHIFELKPNDTLSFKGPIVKWKWTPNQYKEITLIGGGTGITPLYQLIHEILKDSSDNTKINLLYGSQTVKDILMYDTLSSLAAKHPDQLKVSFFVDKADKSWSGKTGFITKEVLSKELPGPSDDSHVFVCGPKPLYEAISGNKVSPSDQGEVTGALGELGYDKTHVFKF